LKLYGNYLQQQPDIMSALTQVYYGTYRFAKNEPCAYTVWEVDTNCITFVYEKCGCKEWGCETCNPPSCDCNKYECCDMCVPVMACPCRQYSCDFCKHSINAEMLYRKFQENFLAFDMFYRASPQQSSPSRECGLRR